MNRLLYRIIFNKARGMLMVVAEIARACSGSSPSSGISHTHSRLASRLSAISLCLWLTAGIIQPVQAAIVADKSAPGNQQPTVIGTANGTPQVNIQTPSAGGVSRNVYRQFDVDQKGLILNNSRKNSRTQLGGMVTANPWLAKGEAKIILNEVNARDPSKLNGYIEVAGQKAQVVIANPSGITCNGCGFINAGRATLTTGTPQMQNGSITGYQVARGEIVISGSGLDTTLQDHTDIIARAVKINAAIHAHDLKITTGRNQVDAAHEQVTAQVENSADKPQFALDVSQVGGMYAGKIRLRGTEKGVGVRNAGYIGASVGEVRLTADGMIENSGAISAKGNTALASKAGVRNSGSIWSSSDADINAAGHVENSGAIAASGHTQIKAATITSTANGTLASGITSNGTTGNGGNLSLTASGRLETHGLNVAGGNLSASGQGLDVSGSKTQAKNITLAAGQQNISTVGAQIIANEALNTATAGTHNNDGGLLAADRLTLTAKRLQNNQGQIVQSGTQALTLNHLDGIENREGTIATNARDLTLQASTLDNRDGEIIYAGNGVLNISSATFTGERGNINSSGALLLKGGDLVLNNGTTTAKSIRIDADNLSNREGQLLQSGNGTMALNARYHTDNRDGLIVTTGHVQLNTASLDNRQGQIAVQGNLTFSGQTLDNGNGGLVQSGADMMLILREIDNRDSGDTGGIISQGNMQITSASLLNDRGLLLSGKQAILDSSRFSNIAGTLVALEQLRLTTRSDTDNQEGLIQGNGVDLVTGGHCLDNREGTIYSLANMQLATAALNNQNGIFGAKSDFTLRADWLDNSNGTLLTGQNLTITNGGTFDNSRGELAAGGTLSLAGTALNLVNTAGVVKAGEDVAIQADRISGDGQLLSLGNMVLNSRQDLVNTGEMIANGNFTLNTPSRVTNNGKLLAGAKLDLNAGNLHNSAGGEIAAGHTWLTVANTLTNYGLIDGNWTLLKAGTLTNTGTGRIYGDYVGIQAGTLNNLAENGAAAVIAARERADIGANVINNRDHALIYSAGDMAVGGRLDASGRATGQAGMLNNHSSTIEAAGNLVLAVGQLNNINDHFSTEVEHISSEEIHEYQHNGSPNRWDAKTEGVFIDHNSADRLLNLNTPEDTGHNNDNFYEYRYTRTIEEEVIKESDPGKIFSGGRLSISAGHVVNDKSQIVAGGTLAIAANTLDNVIPEGSRWISDEGTVTHYSRKSSKGSDSQHTSTSDYVPPTVIQSITLRPGKLEGNSIVKGSGLQLAAATQQGTDATISDIGNITAGVNGREVPVNGGVDDSNPTVVRITVPNTQLPDNNLFKTHPEPDAAYLVETDPRFTSNKKWLGSDYMQNAFAINNDNMHKRLGDGYYEQRLVREQVIALTGGRYLGNHRNDEAQFKALMDAGIAYGQKYHLIPGVALTAEQMSLLTEDMVWLVSTLVQLADGSWQTVMVPQVYVRLKPGDTEGSGALLGGQNVALNLNGDLLNSGAISGREVVQLNADNITNLAGTVRGADVSLQARTDINHIGGIISGNNSVLASAERDINIVTATRSAQRVSGNNSFERTTVERVGAVYVQGDDGILSLSAGRDVSLAGAQVVNRGQNGQTVLNAGRDLNLNIVTTSASDSITWDKNNWLKQAATQHTGSEINGAGAVAMVAGRDINAQAAAVSAGDTLDVVAEREINITAAIDSSMFESRHKYTGSSGIFSKTAAATHDVINRETVQGSLFSGDSVKMQAGNSLLVRGSDVVADNDVHLGAGNNLTITGAEARSSESHQRQEKKSGLSGTGGIGVTYGSQSLKVIDTAQSVTQQGSTVGSVNGSVILSAGNNLNVQASDVIAGNDITLAGKKVSVTSATENSRQTHEVEQKSSGFTLALSGSAGSALNTAVSTGKQAMEESSGRLAALQGVKAALGGVSAAQAQQLDEAQGGSPENTSTVGISLSYGSQSSKTTQTNEQTNAKGSSLTAGNNLSVIASGSGQKGGDGDIVIQGSRVSAGNDVLLSAERDVNLMSTENRSRLEGKNESRGGSVGVGIGVGSGGWGINVSAGVNAGKGKESGNGTTHTETTVDAGNNLTIISGRDTTLTGAQVSGERVTADIGRDLSLRSEQDSDSWHSKQQEINAGGSFSFGSMSGTASINASRDRMESNYKSVNEQTGIFAGKGGFDITTGGHTQLDGAVIASTAKADKNRLETGTLGWSDIHNEAEYKVEHQSVGISTGGSIGGQFAGNMANGMLAGVNGSGSAEGTTSSAISGGNIIIRDKDNQQQKVESLSRDTENANGSIGEIFDKEREQERLKEAQLIGEIGVQVADIARTQGDLAGLSEAKKQHPGLSADELRKTDTYKAEMAKYGTGSSLQRGMQAATAVIQGLAGGDIAKAAAGGNAPYIANIIGSSGLDDAGKVMAHAAVNAVLAAAQGNNALISATGAATAEMAGMIAQNTYGKQVSELSETEKQTVSALATLAAGLAGGLTGNSTADAVAGAQAGKTTVENNALGAAAGSDLGFWLGKTPDATAEDKAKLAGDIAKGNAIVSAELAGSVGLGVLPKGAQITAVIGGGANTIIQYVVNGEVNYTDALIASWVGAATSNTGLLGTVGWNAAGGATSNYIKGDDPLSGAIISGGSAGIGYGLGQAVKGPLDKVINPNWKNWEWVDVGMGVSKPMPLDPRPAVIGNIISSGSTEGIGQGGPKAVSSSKEGEK